MSSSANPHRLELLNEREAFWLDCIRAACPGGVPSPTLAKAQALRRLFTSPVPLQEREEADDDGP